MEKKLITNCFEEYFKISFYEYEIINIFVNFENSCFYYVLKRKKK